MNVTVHMKSGKSFVIRNVREYSTTLGANGFSEYSFKFYSTNPS